MWLILVINNLILIIINNLLRIISTDREGVNNICQQTELCHHPQGNTAVSCPDYSGCLQQSRILPSMFGEIITPEAHRTAKHDSLLKKHTLKESYISILKKMWATLASVLRGSAF